MRGKTKILSIASLVFIIAILIIILGKPFGGTQNETGQKDAASLEGIKSNSDKNSNETEVENTEICDAGMVKAQKIVKSEEVPVFYNTPALNLKVYLKQNALEETYLDIEYLNDGISTVKVVDEKQISEIKDIFKKRENITEAEGEKKGHRVKAAYLNEETLKVYLVVEGKHFLNGVKTSMYSYDLNTSSAENIFSADGDFTKLSLSEDRKHIGLSYKDMPVSSVYEEDSLVQIVDCESNSLIVKESRDLSGNTIGKNRNPELVYNYTFLSWETNVTARLKEKVWRKGTSDSNNVEKEVLYHIKENLFLNTDGSVIEDSNNTDEKNEEKTEQVDDGTAQKALQDFYTYLSIADTEQYDNAMNLLDEGFVLELKMFKQFGVSEIRKSDIDLDSVSLYMEMLKCAKLISIVKQEGTQENSTIDYIQAFSMGDGSEFRQELTAELKKYKDGWKILSVREKDKEE